VNLNIKPLNHVMHVIRSSSSYLGPLKTPPTVLSCASTPPPCLCCVCTVSMVHLDFIVFGCALLPVLLRLHALELLPALLDARTSVVVLRWWVCVVGLALLYALHGFIWNRPAKFTALCRRLPLRLLGSHPVDVFAACEILGKLWQAAMLVALISRAGLAAAADSLAFAPLWCWAVLAVYLLVGQGLNVAMYAAIGNAGVYYGFKLGREVPWCSSFPFNVGLRHPQYVGVVLTILGGATVIVSAPLVENGLLQALLAWTGMYIGMAASAPCAAPPTARRQLVARAAQQPAHAHPRTLAPAAAQWSSSTTTTAAPRKRAEHRARAQVRASMGSACSACGDEGPSSPRVSREEAVDHAPRRRAVPRVRILNGETVWFFSRVCHFSRAGRNRPGCMATRGERGEARKRHTGLRKSRRGPASVHDACAGLRASGLLADAEGGGIKGAGDGEGGGGGRSVAARAARAAMVHAR
jgi:hypothetical protein